jgi:hypothetical protein
MEVYRGQFGSWADVQREFEMDVPEPDDVIYAEYDTPPYEGYANVIYRNGDRYYWAYGSHCSCFGLEGQWDPEEYDARSRVEVLRRGNHWRLDDPGRHVQEHIVDAVMAYPGNGQFEGEGHA